MKTLYKKDSKGKIRIWKIHTKGAKLIQEAGLLEGKLTTNEKTCTGKNIGKSNETTPKDQAKLELESEYRSKLDEGYFETKDEAENNIVLLPMLAKTYEDHKDKIDWNNCYIQPKLDGMRCLAKISKGKVQLISREGKEIQNMDHIIKELSEIKQDVILDGELYAHGLSFQENMRLIKKYRKGETENIIFHIYDSISEESFWERSKNVFNAIHSVDYGNLWDVDTNKIYNEKELQKYHAQFIQEGYEGSIVRWGEKGYKLNSRSENLLKYKDFQDIALPILDIIPASQRPEWGVPQFELKGKKFEAGMRYSHKEREDFLKNKSKYIGKTAEIRFFEYSDDGIPRFPVMVGIRLDK